MEMLMIILIIALFLGIFENRFSVEILLTYFVGVSIAYFMQIDEPLKWPIVLYQFIKSEMGK